MALWHMASLDSYCESLREGKGQEGGEFERRQEMRRARGYLDLGVYTEAIEDYVVEYLCKDEVSATRLISTFSMPRLAADPGDADDGAG